MWHRTVRVSYPPPPDSERSATPPSAPAGQYSPDGRWYWNGREWIPAASQWPAWARPYAPAEGRATAAVVLVGMSAAGTALGLLTAAVDLFTALTSPGSDVSLAQNIISLLAFLPYIAGTIGAMIAVPIWMHRAYRNLPALGEQGMHWSPAWAAGGWFIPFVNLAVPYLVMRDLWSRFGDARPLPQQWWTAVVGGLLLRSVGGAFYGPAAVFNRPLGDVLGILGNTALVLGGYLVIVMMLRISRLQRDRQVQLQSR